MKNYPPAAFAENMRPVLDTLEVLRARLALAGFENGDPEWSKFLELDASLRAKFRAATDQSREQLEKLRAGEKVVTVKGEAYPVHSTGEWNYAVKPAFSHARWFSTAEKAIRYLNSL